MQAHQDYHVTPLSQTDLADLTKARVEFQSLALPLTIDRSDLAWSQCRSPRTTRLVHNNAGTGRGNDESEPSDAAFHLALPAGCPNRRVLRAAGALREEAELYRQWSVSRSSTDEHLALLGAALDRDAGRAADLLREHIAHTARLLVDPARGAGT